MAALLIESDADVTAVNQLGETALHLAVRKGRADVVTLLLDSGAPVLLRTKEGKTAADEARAQNFSSIANVLDGIALPHPDILGSPGLTRCAERAKDIQGKFFHMNLDSAKRSQPPMRYWVSPPRQRLASIAI